MARDSGAGAGVAIPNMVPVSTLVSRIAARSMISAGSKSTRPRPDLSKLKTRAVVSEASPKVTPGKSLSDFKKGLNHGFVIEILEHKNSGAFKEAGSSVRCMKLIKVGEIVFSPPPHISFLLPVSRRMIRTAIREPSAPLRPGGQPSITAPPPRSRARTVVPRAHGQTGNRMQHLLDVPRAASPPLPMYSQLLAPLLAHLSSSRHPPVSLRPHRAPHPGQLRSGLAAIRELDVHPKVARMPRNSS